MVADSLVYHPTVAHYLKFVATTVGRDKVMRTLQYFCRFYTWYLFRLNASPAEMAPYQAIKSQFGSIRKALRLGKFVEHIKAAAQAYDAKSASLDPFLRFLAIGRQLGYASYMTFDNIQFLHSSGIRKMEAANAARIQEVAYRSWFVGLACNAIAGVYQLVRLRQRAAAVNMKDGEGVVEAKRIERERAAVNLQLVSDLCDITVPSFGLGLAPFLDDGIVGLAGTTSSLIGVYSIWQKTV